MADKTEKTEFVSPREIARQLCVTPETLLAWSKAGRFPAPIEFGRRSRRWKRSAVETFLNQKQLEAKMTK